ncbi:MAG: hypothetical protein AAGA68_17485 [Pseudomonadota bacterium]
MGRIALLTCRDLPEPDPDEALTLQAFRAAGYDAQLLAWNAPGESPGAFDLCIIRSTWDYIWHVEAFDAFLSETARVTHLCNSLEAVRWNVHKRYLAALEAAGLPVTPTLHVGRGEPPTMHEFAQLDWGSVVVKPAVSGSSYATRRFAAHAHDEALAFLRDLTARRDAMVQPYISTVEQGGERALVCIDGELSHAIVKTARFKGDQEQVSAAHVPTGQERAFVQQALACLPASLREGLLYARVDVFDDGAGGLLLSELELIEPSLYFVQAPRALDAFVAAVERRLR